MNYLMETDRINYRHPIIDELFETLNPDGTDTAFLQNVFSFARDAIRFEFCDFHDKISDTVSQLKGHCYHKTNLIVGLCRKKGIEAGIQFVRLRPEALAPYLSEELLPAFASEPIGHFLPVIRVNGEWVAVDPIFDAPLLRHSGRQHWIVAKNWDGRSFAKLPPEMIVDEHNEISDRAFPDDQIPTSSAAQLAQMNEKLLSIRREIEAEGE